MHRFHRPKSSASTYFLIAAAFGAILTPASAQTTNVDVDALVQMERQDFGIAAPAQLHAGAFHGPTPTSIPGGQVVTTKELVSLVQAQRSAYALFDVLGSEETLPGALPLVWASQAGTFNDAVQQRLAGELDQASDGNRKMPLVFYCLSNQCWMSYNAALRAINLGYKNVLWYRGGIEAWKMAGLPTGGQGGGQQPPMMAGSQTRSLTAESPPPTRQPSPQPQRTRQPEGSLPAGTLHMVPSVIVDSTGFEAPIAASTLFIPHGWRTEGGVSWGNEYMCTNGYNFNWSATSPDGLTTIAVLPQTRWEWNNYGAGPSTPGCQIASYTNITQYLDAMVQFWRPGARVLEHRPREDLVRDFSRFNAVTPMPMGESRTWVEAGEAAFTLQHQGQNMRGTVAAVVIFSLMRTNTGSNTMEALNGNALPAYGAIAPDKAYNAGLFEAIRRSITTNPQWDARISNHNTKIARVAIEESRKRSEIITRSNDEISRIRQEAWASSQESIDRRAREFGEVIRGVETYNDPDAPGGTVELSNTYDHSWRLNDGSYVLTNDPNFEPYRDLQVDGKKLEPTK